MTNTAEDFCDEEHIYFYCLNFELIYEQFLCHIYLQYYYNIFTAYHDSFQVFLVLMDNYYAIHVINQDIRNQLLICIHQNYLYQSNLHQIYQFVFYLTIYIYCKEDVDSLPNHINYLHPDM